MARFDKIARLAYECFKYKIEYFGWIGITKKDNYIGVVLDESGYTITDMIYDPEQRFLKIMTFDKEHVEEDNFSGLLKNLGVKSEVELCSMSQARAFFGDDLPHSPSGRMEKEMLEEIKREEEERE